VDDISFEGQDVPFVGTIAADNETYTIHFVGTLCWYPGAPWQGIATTAMGDSGMSFEETKAALQKLAQDDWHAREAERDIVCSARDFQSIRAWGRIELA
jgi:hypothetical protein